MDMAKKKAKATTARATRWPTRYKKDFLDQVIARIDFAAPLGITPGGPPNSVVKAAKQSFPVAEQKKFLMKTIHLKPTATPAVTEEHREEKHEWWYHSKDRQKLFKIADNTLVLEYKRRKYRSFGGLQKDFLPVVHSLYDAFGDLQVQRLGLRYIDKIELDEKNPTEWSRYLRDDLLAIFNLADDRARVSRALHWLEFNYGDTHLRFQYGMANPDYPAPIRQKVFTLDYDGYCTLLLNKDEIGDYLTRLHEKIRTAFEKVIRNPLRQKMEPVNAD